MYILIKLLEHCEMWYNMINIRKFIYKMYKSYYDHDKQNEN